MSGGAGRAAKRFWKVVAVEARGDGHAVLLDGRAARTPGRGPLLAPNLAVAEAAAAEWAAQGEKVEPASMPVTRALNTAIDLIGDARAGVEAEVTGFGGSDLLCHRAAHPSQLAARQAEIWDPLLDWAAEAHGARLIPTQGVMPVAQSALALAALEAAVAAHSDLSLTGLHDLTALSGSLVIGLAVASGRLSADAGWAASRIDEDWQISQWGADEEAEVHAARRKIDFDAAARLISLLGA